MIIEAERRYLESFTQKAMTMSSIERIYLLREYTTWIYALPRHVNIKKRKKILRKQWKTNRPPCWVCGYRAKKRHHVIPLSNGGSNRGINIRPLCTSCEGCAHGDPIPWDKFALAPPPIQRPHHHKKDMWPPHYFGAIDCHG